MLCLRGLSAPDSARVHRAHGTVRRAAVANETPFRVRFGIVQARIVSASLDPALVAIASLLDHHLRPRSGSGSFYLLLVAA